MAKKKASAKPAANDLPVAEPAVPSPANLNQQLMEQTICVRLLKCQFGRRRAWDDEQIAQAATTFQADPEYMGGWKRIINHRCEEYRAVSSLLSKATKTWKRMSIPFPEPGKRLMRRDKLDAFEARMTTLQAALTEAVAKLNEKYPTLQAEAQERLKELYNADDYPASLLGHFHVDWDYPSTSPPEFLKQLNPDLYQQQVARMQARFDEAIALAEQAFAAEFAKAVASLIGKLQPETVCDWFYEGPTTLELSAAGGGTEGQQALAESSGLEQRGDKIKWRDAAGKLHKREFDFAERATEWLIESGCRKTGERQEKKAIKETAVEGLKTFFDRFSELSIRSNGALDALVAQAKDAVQLAGQIGEGAAGDALRENLQGSLATIGQTLDDMIVAAGGRRIVFGQDSE
jgi:multidrug efflux pump subunit AcrA (membrane-fusion protein)